MLETFDIGHPSHVALIGADAAFWALVRRDRAGGDLDVLLTEYEEKKPALLKEMHDLRFRLKPSCVYFNPTQRCNLDCSYCYLPRDERKGGRHMTTKEVLSALAELHEGFRATLPAGCVPQVIFHGAEPLLNRDAVFEGIAQYGDRFRFGVQTNATLLDDEAIAFLTRHRVGIGLSLDGPVATVSNRTRSSWGGTSSHSAVVSALDKLRGYRGHSVICTITRENVEHLSDVVDSLHEREVPACMLNVVRCTMPGARAVRASDEDVVPHYLAALERSHEHYVRTGRKLVVANFANILLAIVAPTARRLMCDISPCGAGRSFFALAANGDLYPCSEFLGLPAFGGGNLFRDGLAEALDTSAFRSVTERKVEDIEPCRGCVIRHFCGAPCPAEACEMNGGMDRLGGYCHFYREQARFAFCLVADGREDDFLWDGWREGTRVTFGSPLA